MTMEEVIFCLKGIKNYGRDVFTSKSQSDWQGSLDMAIKALEQTECEDCISRKDVLNLAKYYGKAFLINPNNVRKLPSVRPKEKVGHWKRISIDKYVQHAQFCYNCSECGNDIIGEYPYCPHCGCRMVESEEEE